MRVSYYAHAWQAFLMFLAGLVSVGGSFAGYVQSGGVDELVKRALSNFTTGRASFKSFDFDWRNGEIVINRLSWKDFTDKDQNSFQGLIADKVYLKLDLFEWHSAKKAAPGETANEKIYLPAVRNIKFVGMSPALAFNEGFMQHGGLGLLSGLGEELDKYPIEFDQCDLNVTIGKLRPLALSGCSGMLNRGPSNNWRGTFSLNKLNGKTFKFKIELLEDGRWVLNGDGIDLDTAKDLEAPPGWPFAERLDPVGLLVRALFSGEMGVKGSVPSLRLVIQPGTDHRKFVCEGDVGYQGLEFRLPPASKETGQALPFFLDQLLGATLWPRWMQVDTVRTGQRGRVSFSMADGRLNFFCDDGKESAFIGVKDGQVFPPLESLKGTFETDSEGKPNRINISGFVGDQLSFKTWVTRNSDRSRTYELQLQPRGSSATEVEFGKPLWRFASRVHDFFGVAPVPKDDNGSDLLVKFELEADTRHFPVKEWLPPGLQEIAGRMAASGSVSAQTENGALTGQKRLRLDTLSLDDGGVLTFGAGGNAVKPGELQPLWLAVETLFGTQKPWTIRDLSLRGSADVSFGKDMMWQSTTLKDWSIASGSIDYAGTSSDLSAEHITLRAAHEENQPPHLSVDALGSNWKINLSGKWHPPGAGAPAEPDVFTLREENVPASIHPQRIELSSKYVKQDRVNRTTTVKVWEGKAERVVKP